MRPSLALATLLLLGGGALAEPPPPDAGSCTVEQRRAEALESELKACRSEARALDQRAQSVSAELSTSAQKLGECTVARENLSNERERLCTGSSDLVQAVLLGKPLPDGLEGCVEPTHRNLLTALLAGWAHTAQALAALAAFESGSADHLPVATPNAPTAIERQVQLLLPGHGQPPPQYRRLLIEALGRIAPRFARRLRSSPTWLEGWLASETPLDDTLIREAQTDPRVTHGEAGETSTDLLTAAKLLDTFSELADCGHHPRARGCPRAEQLHNLLEQGGPLAVRRREQTIWATDCNAIAPATVLAWFAEFPAAARAISASDWRTLEGGAFSKLYGCYLADRDSASSFPVWLDGRLPDAEALTRRTLAHLDAVRATFTAGGLLDRCARAVRALQTAPTPERCEARPALTEAVGDWLARRGDPTDEAGLPLDTCSTLARLLWEGRPATIPSTFPHPPRVGELVHVDATASAPPLLRTRELCEQRRGGSDRFPLGLNALSRLARGFSEPIDEPPWRAEPSTGAPLEDARFRRAATLSGWLRTRFGHADVCDVLGLQPARCQACTDSDASESYDCALGFRLRALWRRYNVRALGSLGALTLAVLLALWALAQARARRQLGAFGPAARVALSAIGLKARPDRWRFLFPSRQPILHVELPSTPAWVRWGPRAAMYRAGPGTRVGEREVNRAAQLARSIGADVAILVHDEAASLELGAVRALLEWAARGPNRAVQILPISSERLGWAQSADDLLDLVEQSSLRGNPFEVRGRITSSSQFFDRERLVSGMLAGAQAGHWLVVTGLRRFGKSSLALEVARRLPGPSGYVDLSGYFHEIALSDDPGRAADAILRDLCARLYESARARLGPFLPEPPAGSLSTTELSEWFGAFARRAAEADPHHALSILLILDEVEQALGVGPDRLARALDVFSVLLGRMRSAFGNPSSSPGGARVGVLLCSALHPLLWAPLATLANQSLMGSFASVCVPVLDEPAALSMMRGLGARQGIRFADAALETLVREAQGIPLLVRRLGSSLLELYDPERARQGGLGAVEVGVEGTAAAVRREEAPGSPLRVWVESEIAEPASVAGRLLRRIAADERTLTAELRAIAATLIQAQLAVTGLDRLLDPDERRRRAEEAAAVHVRLLGETGLVVPEGDLTDPEAYRWPDSLVRRILAKSKS